MNSAEGASNALLSPLDSTVLIIGFAAAAGLYILRRMRKRVSAQGQFLMDWLGVWTIIELALIAISSFNRPLLAWFNLNPPLPSEIISSNGILLPIAMMYCAGLVAKNTFQASWEAIKEPDKKGAQPKAHRP